MAAPVADNYVGSSGEVLAGGRFYLSAKALVSDGIWCWFTDPRAVTADGETYIGWIDSAGSVGVSKYDPSTQNATSFILHTALELDDHNHVAVLIRSDGRVVCFYGKHNADVLIRYRVSINPHDISAFGVEQTFSASWGTATYSNPHFLSQTGKTYVHYRAWGYVSGVCASRATSDFVTWDAERQWIKETGQRPYVKSISNGVDRIDFLFTNCHPAENQSSIYHCYMRLDAGVEKFYKSDGTYIGTGPVAPASCTQIYDGTSVKGWIWDIRYGDDGHPMVLITRFPSTTDHRYLYSRFDGAAWTASVEIVSAGTYLYSAEPYYSGGACFDSSDPSVVYLSKQVGAAWEIQKFVTHDDGATWVKTKDITSGSTVKNARPFSPLGHDGSIPVLWWSGLYTSYANYDTDVLGLVR